MVEGKIKCDNDACPEFLSLPIFRGLRRRNKIKNKVSCHTITHASGLYQASLGGRDRSGRPLPSAGDRMLASDWSRAPILASDWLPHLTSAPGSTGGL